MANKPDKLLDFPCDFPIKIMGKSHIDFETEILEIIQKHAPDFDEQALVVRASKNSNYIAITAIINATSQQQLDTIYLELSSHEKVIMAL